VGARQFSIQCPHCLLWSTEPGSISEWFVPPTELPLVLGAIRDKKDHPKLIRCRHRAYECVAPYQGFVCQTLAEANDAVRLLGKELRNTWSPTLLVRPRCYPEAQSPSHPGYVVCCFTEAVRREPEICLTQLLDRVLLSKMVAGFQAELGGPVTFFEGRVAKDDEVPHWRPIEAFTPEEGSTPSSYSPFCKLCREVTEPARNALIDRLTMACPRRPDGTIGCGEEACPAVTGRSEAWTRCPEFLSGRLKVCACYSSDKALLDEVTRSWQGGSDQREYEGRCWANLVECAVPVVVHDHLLAVAMTGQMLIPGDQLPDVETLVTKHPALAGYVNELHGIKKDLQNAQDMMELGSPAPEAWRWVLVSNKQELRRRVEAFSRDVAHVADAAYMRYQQLRLRSEQLFRTYLFGLMDTLARDSIGIEALVPTLLDEMRRFWAIKRAFLLAGSDIDEGLRQVGQDGGSNPEADGVKWAITLDNWAEPRLIYFSRSSPADREQTSLVTLAQQLLQNPGPQWALGVLIPAGMRRLLFVFAGRHQNKISRLPSRHRAEVSLFARSLILDTCKMVGERLRDMWHVDDTLDNATTIGHEIRSALALIRQNVSRLSMAVQGASAAEQMASGHLAEQARRTVRAARAGLDAAGLNLDRLALQGGLARELSAATLVTVNLKDVIERLTPFFELLWQGPSRGEPGIDVARHWKGDLTELSNPCVVAEPKLLTLAVRNLLDNAFKYSFPGRTVHAKAWTDEDGMFNIVELQNCGPTIEQDEKEKVLKRGYRGKNARRRKNVASEGTGLGLFLVDQIIKRFRGVFEIYSQEEGSLTIARVHLPTARMPNVQHEDSTIH
jgi:signal transduction histidine kinase